eukprot:GHVU01102037.1.p1 GENE.GHVU01102037.1~~GHVU01102037.1.p1  ORF type:complete len:148 (-),score=28.27 GHVU01102037.1:126-569(-)
MSDAARSRPAASSADQVDARGAADAGTQCPTADERMQLLMQEMEGRIQSSIQQQLQRVEGRIHTSLQQHAEDLRGIDMDRVRQCVAEVLQLQQQQQQQQGAAAATHGMRVFQGARLPCVCCPDVSWPPHHPAHPWSHPQSCRTQKKK